jgi:hypothetical protein
MIALLAAAAISLSCTVDPPRSVSTQGVAANPIGLPPEMNRWTFDLALTPRPDKVEVKLDWPGDPIRTGRALSAISVGPHDYSFISLHPGPCLFTQTQCVFMYTLSVQKDGTAQILIQPSALASEGEWSKPFQVYMTGRCTPKGERG